MYFSITKGPLESALEDNTVNTYVFSYIKSFSGYISENGGKPWTMHDSTYIMDITYNSKYWQNNIMVGNHFLWLILKVQNTRRRQDNNTVDGNTCIWHLPGQPLKYVTVLCRVMRSQSFSNISRTHRSNKKKTNIKNGDCTDVFGRYNN